MDTPRPSNAPDLAGRRRRSFVKPDPATRGVVIVSNRGDIDGTSDSEKVEPLMVMAQDGTWQPA